MNEITLEFHKKFPEHKDIIFTDHASERIMERFGGVKNQMARAVINGKKYLKNKAGVDEATKYYSGDTYLGRAIMTKNKDNNYIVITVWNKKGELNEKNNDL